MLICCHVIQRSIKIKSIMMKKILFSTMLLFALIPARAEWVKVDTAAKQRVAHYFDPDSTQQNGYFIKTWVLSSYDQKQAGGYQSVKSLYELDCQEGKARSYTLLLYPDAKAASSVIGAQHDPSEDWFGYSANSPLGHIAKIVCGK